MDGIFVSPSKGEIKKATTPSELKNRERKKEKEEKDQKNATTLKKGKQPTFKQVFDSPYTVHWPNVSDENRNFIVEQLTSDLSNYIAVPPKKTISMEERKKLTKEEKKQLKAERKKMQKERRRIEKEQKKKLPPSMCFGINEVTRGLEREKLRLVIVCKDVQPLILIQHLPVLAKIKGVPLCPLSNSTAHFAKLFGMRSIVAFGFKVHEDNSTPDIFGLLVESIIAKVPPIGISWLNIMNSEGKMDPSKLELLPTNVKQTGPKRPQVTTDQPQSKKVKRDSKNKP